MARVFGRGKERTQGRASKPLGVETCAAAVDLAAKFNVDLPIIQQMHAVLYEGKPPREALRDLLDRSLKSE